MNLSYKVRGEDIRLNPLNKFEMEDGEYTEEIYRAKSVRD
jgi:hypothetical protein